MWDQCYIYAQLALWHHQRYTRTCGRSIGINVVYKQVYVTTPSHLQSLITYQAASIPHVQRYQGYDAYSMQGKAAIHSPLAFHY